MAIILHIDTAVNSASVCLARDARALQFAWNENQKDHAAWLHAAIEGLMSNAGMMLKDVQAVAVTIGPGSYTGLRIGLATAKGLCFALQIPLICINTLEMMAYALLHEEADYFCPMIDARRMEVFMACYDKKMGTVIAPCAMIVEAGHFDALLRSGKVIFSGNGSGKLKKLIDHPHAMFSDITTTAAHMIRMAENNYAEKRFNDVAYTEPFYIKEFYSTAH